jgi:hypothetical protein
VHKAGWIEWARQIALWATFGFTIISAVHYVFLVGQRLRRLHPA